MKTTVLLFMSGFFLFTGSLTINNTGRKAEKESAAVFSTGRDLNTSTEMLPAELYLEDEERSIEQWMTEPSAWVTSSVKSKSAKKSAKKEVIAIDKVSVIENWMTDPKQWVKSHMGKSNEATNEISPSTLPFDFTEDINTEIEQWMTTPQTWVKSDSTPVENDNKEIEEWMTNPLSWIK